MVAGGCRGQLRVVSADVPPALTEGDSEMKTLSLVAALALAAAPVFAYEIIMA